MSHSGHFIGEPVFLVVVAKTFCDKVLKMSNNQSAHLGVRKPISGSEQVVDTQNDSETRLQSGTGVLFPGNGTMN